MTATPLHSVTPSDATRNLLEETLTLQRAAYFAHPYPSFAERKADLLQLKAFIQDNRDAIVDAISADYGNRSRHETLFAENATQAAEIERLNAEVARLNAATPAPAKVAAADDQFGDEQPVSAVTAEANRLRKIKGLPALK